MTMNRIAYSKMWITPKEQLDRLYAPLTEKVNQAVISFFPKVLIGLTLEYAREPILFLWYEALRKLNLLHIKLPPLPENILELLDEPCPFHPDLQIKQTHILNIVPQELGTLRRLESETLQKYAASHVREGGMTYKLDYTDRMFKAHYDESFEQTHWELLTTTVVPGTRGISFPLQVAVIKKSKKNHETPSFQGMVAGIYFHKLTTGILLYCKQRAEEEISKGKKGSSVKSTATLVRDQYAGRPLAVGHFSAKGLSVSPHFDFGKNPNVGMAGVIYL